MTLPLQQRDLLASCLGRELVEVERLTSTSRSRFGDDFFCAVSGPTQLTFSGHVVHTLTTVPSELSVLVSAEPLGEDPYADRYRLSCMAEAPTWLRCLLGQRVSDVRIYLYRDDVPSDEARQAAVSYHFDNGAVIVYGIYVHGRMDGDELFTASELITSTIDHRLSVLDAGQWT